MSDLHITPWRCPFCVAGLIGNQERCLHCHGTGLTADPCGPAERAPRPPAVMRAPCADCAYRPGSPELDQAGVTLPEEEPFYCHQGLPVSGKGAYTPVATFKGLPLGAMVCAGWWAQQTGEPLPARAYRERPIDPTRHWDVPYALREGQLSDEQREVLGAWALCGVETRLPFGGTAVCARAVHPGDPWHRAGDLMFRTLEPGEPAGPELIRALGVDEMTEEQRAAFGEVYRAHARQYAAEMGGKQP